MNKSAVIEELCWLLDDVLIHPEVVNEIRQLILGTGNEKQFLRQLAKQLELYYIAFMSAPERKSAVMNCTRQSQ